MTKAFMKNMKTLAEVLFGPNRVAKAKILLSLKGRSLYVTQIAREIGIDQPTATAHLKALENAGLVSCKTFGPMKMYSLTEYAEKEIIPCLEKFFQRINPKQ